MDRRLSPSAIAWVAMKADAARRRHQFRSAVKEVADVVGVARAPVHLSEPVTVPLAVFARDAAAAEERHVAAEGIDAALIRHANLLQTSQSDAGPTAQPNAPDENEE